MSTKWINARYATVCAYCDKAILEKERVLWLTEDKAVACEDCVHDHDLDDTGDESE